MVSNGNTLPENHESALDRAQKAAAIYAWDYFQYHAGQRQSVFRFFLTLVGVLTLAYGYSLRYETTNAIEGANVRLAIGCMLLIIGFLFWRLDKRSQNLIKASEAALKQAEIRLSVALGGDETIKLIHIDGNKSKCGPLSYIESFRQVYSLIFILVGFAGALIIVHHFGLKVLF